MMAFVFLILVIVFLGVNVRVVPQTEAYIIERLGAYLGTWLVGLHFKIPVVDRIAAVVSLKEQIKDFRPQAVITRDNVTMTIDTVVFYQVTDPKAYVYGVENPILAIDNITTTTLRNIIGELELDETLTSRDVINAKMRSVLDAATGAWGIKVHRVEVKNIVPPAEIQESMERQMKAEREKRESILRAEGEKQAAIRVAEGHKEAVILNAEAEKKSAILIAEANREAAIREAEGEAEAILKVQRATAEGLKMLKSATPDNQVIAIKSLETLAKVADGQATKIIIPSELQNLTALAASLSEIVKDNPQLS
ncbi:MAG: SPFH/Band 7/PHB domain protein [Clostridia bacterium]|nr:SPFH/Band 7/PHB domain protein [Clostridia bacterium]MDD4665911.1 SPFH/Band 7/PHB domain protein [Clostridia bacterium]